MDRYELQFHTSYYFFLDSWKWINFAKKALLKKVQMYEPKIECKATLTIADYYV